MTGPHYDPLTPVFDQKRENERRDAIADNISGKGGRRADYTIKPAGWPLLFGLLWLFYGIVNTGTVAGALLYGVKGVVIGLVIMVLVSLFASGCEAMLSRMKSAYTRIGRQRKWCTWGMISGAIIGGIYGHHVERGVVAPFISSAPLGAFFGYVAWFAAAFLVSLAPKRKS